MNWDEFKVPISYLCLVDSMITSCPLAQEVVGSNKSQLQLFWYKYLGKTEIVPLDPPSGEVEHLGAILEYRGRLCMQYNFHHILSGMSAVFYIIFQTIYLETIHANYQSQKCHSILQTSLPQAERQDIFMFYASAYLSRKQRGKEKEIQ